MKRTMSALIVAALFAAPAAWADKGDKEWKHWAKHERKAQKEWHKQMKHAHKHGHGSHFTEHVVVTQPAPVIVQQTRVVHHHHVQHVPVVQPVAVYPAAPELNVNFRVPLY